MQISGFFLSQPMENTHISESTGTLGAFPHTQHTKEEDRCMDEEKAQTGQSV